MSSVSFPVPSGWFAVLDEDAVADGVLPVRAFGSELVVWRDGDAVVRVHDAFCAHLGAHLGHGGEVVDGCLVCPFHRWRFDGDGVNTSIPYSSRTNARARLGVRQVRVTGGMVLVWHGSAREGPWFDPPELGHAVPDGWVGPFTSSHLVAAPAQELAENGVDLAHFRFVHGTDDVARLVGYETDGPRSSVRTAQRFVTSDGVVEGRIDTVSWGPGVSVVSFSGIVDAVNITSVLPVEADVTEVVFRFFVPAGAGGLGRAFVAEIERQIAQDRPIWEHKTFLPSPALAVGDGPVMAFRRWYGQFYR